MKRPLHKFKIGDKVCHRIRRDIMEVTDVGFNGEIIYTRNSNGTVGYEHFENLELVDDGMRPTDEFVEDSMEKYKDGKYDKEHKFKVGDRVIYTGIPNHVYTISEDFMNGNYAIVNYKGERASDCIDESELSPAGNLVDVDESMEQFKEKLESGYFDMNYGKDNINDIMGQLDKREQEGEVKDDKYNKKYEVLSTEEIDKMIKAVGGDDIMTDAVVKGREHDELDEDDIPMTTITESILAQEAEWSNGYDEGYKKGYKDGQNSLASAYAEGKGEKLLEDVKKVEYERGLNDAWEALRVFLNMNNEDRIEAFGVNQIGRLAAMRSQEAVEKLKAWEEKQEEIKVGDEVTSDAFDNKGIVTHISADGQYIALVCSGSSMMNVGRMGLHKTGRTFPQIAEVLKQMQEKT